MYGLSESDIAFLKRFIRQEQNRPQTTTQRPSTQYIDSPTGSEHNAAPDLYVAFTPGSGIPGGQFNESGTGFPLPYFIEGSECQVYTIDEDTGEVTAIDGLLRKVFNIATDPVPGSSFVSIKKTKGGIWIADLPSTVEINPGTGTGSVVFDCHFTSVSGVITLDLGSLAGSGLGVELTECPRLVVVLGCGLEFDDSENVSLDYVGLVGNRAESSLVTTSETGTGTGCPNIAVDLVEYSDTLEYLVTEIDLEVVDGELSGFVEYTNFVNIFNEAGMLIDRVQGSSDIVFFGDGTGTGSGTGTGTGTGTVDPCECVLPAVIEQFILNAEPGAQLTLYTIVNPTTSTPAIRQYVVQNSGGGIQQIAVNYYPQGTAGAIPLQVIVIPTKVTNQFIFPNAGNPRVLLQTFDNSTTNVIRVAVTSVNVTYGEFNQYLIDASDRTTSITNTTLVYNTSTPFEIVYSAVGANTVAAVTGVLNLEAATATAATQSAGNNTTAIATTAFVTAAVGGANLYVAKFTVNFGQFTAASPAETVTIGSLPQNSDVVFTQAVTTIQWDDGGGSSIGINVHVGGHVFVGTVGNNPPSNTVTRVDNSGGSGLPNALSGTVTVEARAVASVNVNTFTQGQSVFWVYYVILP